MAYTVIGSLRSPFARMTRLFLINNDLEFEFKIINYLEKKDDAVYMAQTSPVNKIPILIDGDQKVYDSRVIANYLNRKHGLAPLSIDEENIQTAIQSCLDVSVNLFLLKRGGLDLEKENWYIQRQRERVPLALEFIKPWMRKLSPDQPQDWSYPSMSLYCYVDWSTHLQLPEMQNQPELQSFVENFRHSRGVSETDFRQR